MEISQLPRIVLERAAQLRDVLRKPYLALALRCKPSTAEEISKDVKISRPQISARLNQLVDMKWVSRTKCGRTVLFKVEFEEA
jgi:DNA-binding transcriptional regulator GbsR (MarR family)